MKRTVLILFYIALVGCLISSSPSKYSFIGFLMLWLGGVTFFTTKAFAGEFSLKNPCISLGVVLAPFLLYAIYADGMTVGFTLTKTSVLWAVSTFIGLWLGNPTMKGYILPSDPKRVINE